MRLVTPPTLDETWEITDKVWGTERVSVAIAHAHRPERLAPQWTRSDPGAQRPAEFNPPVAAAPAAPDGGAYRGQYFPHRVGYLRAVLADAIYDPGGWVWRPWPETVTLAARGLVARGAPFGDLLTHDGVVYVWAGVGLGRYEQLDAVLRLVGVAVIRADTADLPPLTPEGPCPLFRDVAPGVRPALADSPPDDR